LGLGQKKGFLSLLVTALKTQQNTKEAFYYLTMKDQVRDDLEKAYQGSLLLAKDQSFREKEKEAELTQLKLQNELNLAKTRWLTYSLVATAVLAILIMMLFYGLGQQKKLYLEKEVLDVKQKLLKLQVNPHFIYNILNSIQNAVLIQDREKSVGLIAKFSKLTRQILQNSEASLVSIHEEIGLLTNYLDLEKSRTKDSFDYEIIVEDGIDVYQELLPSMILQLFVENAVWHGVIPKERDGVITIHFFKTNRGINVQVIDNGIGIKASKMRKTKSQQSKVSMGLYLVKRRIESLNKQLKKNFELQIGSKEDGIGTIVTLLT